MTHLVFLNVIFFIIPISGASAFAMCIYWLLRSEPPPPDSPPGGTKTRMPSAGPDDLARSA